MTYELRTTRCAKHGHPECVLAFDDPSLADQGAYWIGEIERGIPEGRTFEVGRIPSLDGWPVHPVLRPDGALALHAQVLENYRNVRTVTILDDHGRLAQAQRRFATRYAAFDPPHWLMSVTLCPRWNYGGPVLTREEIEGNASGWVIHCSEQHCSACARDARFHCPSAEWIQLDIAELAVAKPQLVNYLGLPPGYRIDTLHRDPYVEAFEVGYGHDMSRFASLHGSRHLLRKVEPVAGDDAAIELDFERDADMFDEYARYYALERLSERYGLSQAAARATFDRASSYDRLLQFAHWHVRDKLTLEQREIIEAALDVSEPERWKAINDAARKLVPLTGTPFVAWKPVIEEFDKLLERAKRSRDKT